MIKFTLKVQLAMKEMSQKELAEATGIRPSTISAICNNKIKHLPVEAIDKICNELECNPEDFIKYLPNKDL
ncbi:MAG: helix-turn-helix transcriptional regulator [Clostridiales bacterium]|jgi:conserved domain protein|nr:helix-turn-helix transcriptional regulator [Clostridiales bacterium]